MSVADAERQKLIEDFLAGKKGGRLKPVATARLDSTIQLPPQEMVQDPITSQRVTQLRGGRFHGEGATTRERVVNRSTMYEDKKTGEMRRRRLSQVEYHHWAWDNKTKKWNHIRTTHVSEKL